MSFEYQLSATKQKLTRSSSHAVTEDMFTDYEASIYLKYSYALEAFNLKPANVKISLFSAEKHLYYIDDAETYGWKKFAGKGINRYEVPGDHKSVLYPPNNQILAQAIQQVLNNELYGHV